MRTDILGLSHFIFTIPIAHTSSGKTLTLGLPLLAHLLSSPFVSFGQKYEGYDCQRFQHSPHARARDPKTLEKPRESFGITNVAVYGGVDVGPQIKALKKVNNGGAMTTW